MKPGHAPGDGLAPETTACMLQNLRMGCGSSKSVVLQQSASREQLVCSDFLTQESFGSVQPQRAINDEKTSHTDGAEVPTQTNICMGDGTQITSNKAPRGLLNTEFNPTPLEPSAATQHQTSNMQLSPKEHNSITPDQSRLVYTSTTLSTQCTNEVPEEDTQRKRDESSKFPGYCKDTSANPFCIGQESNSSVDHCSNAQYKETINDGGENISLTSYATDGLDQPVIHSAVNIYGPLSIVHLHWQRDAYSMSQSYRIQTLQLQLGFIEKITANSGGKATPI